jgi:hypothetical protein
MFLLGLLVYFTTASARNLASLGARAQPKSSAIASEEKQEDIEIRCALNREC